MIFDFFRKIGGGRPAPDADTAETVAYQGYDLIPAPQKDPAGWRVHGVISRTVDGVRQEYAFTRADTCSGRDDAVAMTVAKAKRLVDEQGERLFEP